MNVKNNIHDALRELSQKLPAQELWWLIEKLTGTSKAQLISCPDLWLTSEQLIQLNEWVHERTVNHKPLQYILGTVPFCGLEISVRPPTLIPRPETEEWVADLIARLKRANIRSFRVLDLCCGSGCIGLALASAFPRATILGVDISDEALALAQENKVKNMLTNIEFLKSDLYSQLPEDFACDLIVSNPPYLACNELAGLSPDVTLWEDKRALIGGETGMEFYEAIISQARRWLKTSTISAKAPIMVLEIGIAQENGMGIILKYNGFDRYEFIRDSYGVLRWVLVMC